MGSTGLLAVIDTYGPILEPSDDIQLDKLQFFTASADGRGDGDRFLVWEICYKVHCMHLLKIQSKVKLGGKIMYAMIF